MPSPCSIMKDSRPHYTQAVDKITRKDCETLIVLALEEDAPRGDPTSEALFSRESQGEAKILAKQKGVLCGLSLIPILLEIDHERGGGLLNFSSDYYDGQRVESGEVVARLSGNLLSLLRLERVILNFLQYLSGISTKTARFVSLLGEYGFILDTRKTLPGFRRLAKYAVYCGGGTNHRLHLSDMIMIKDNHLAAFGDMDQALRRVQERAPELLREVEIDSLEELKSLLASQVPVDKILLDNMDIEQIRAMRSRIHGHFQKVEGEKDKEGERPFIELSGNWDLKKLEKWKHSVTDKEMLGNHLGISVGKLTHSVEAVDFSMEILSASQIRK